jgi:LPXTG-motif cell wall-anchored protein
MDTTTIVLIVGAILFGGLWLMRRRSRMRSDKFD